jgi:hypothetical protein
MVTASLFYRKESRSRDVELPKLITQTMSYWQKASNWFYTEKFISLKNVLAIFIEVFGSYFNIKNKPIINYLFIFTKDPSTSEKVESNKQQKYQNKITKSSQGSGGLRGWAKQCIRMWVNVII